MDRVLLIVDDIQYSRHVEMTLRKVGFEVETINNEFNINETLLTYNPDYIICRGNSNRLSVLNVGRKLKEGGKFNGKTILIFPQGYKLTPDDLIQLKLDLLLFEPISTLRLAVHLFSFSDADFEFVKDKLLKFAITDTQFKNYEQSILSTAGLTFDSEIQYVSGLENIKKPDPVVAETTVEPVVKDNLVHVKDEPSSEIDSHVLKSDQEVAELTSQNLTTEQDVSVVETSTHVKGDGERPKVDIVESKEAPPGMKEPIFPKPEDLTEQQLEAIKEEIASSEAELSLRIDTYNHTINKIDQDLKKGLKKRQTKNEFKKLHKDLIDEGKSDKEFESDLDSEKARFASAMFKKDKK